MCRKTPISVQTDEGHFPGKSSKTKVHSYLGCVCCSITPSSSSSSSSSPVDTLSLKELTLKLLVTFVGVWPKGPNCSFLI